ncbi:MAG: DNA-primase RepB domain-containing protein [Candidatus Thiodiazotropha sp.]
MKRPYIRDPCLSHVARWVALQGQRLEPDREQVARFLKRLDPMARGFSYRTFSDTEYTRAGSLDPLEKAIHGPLDSCWNRLVALNQRGAAVTVTINRTNGVARGVADMRQVRALFVDADREGSCVSFPLKPHIHVETSPGHCHYYWLVRDVPLQHFSACQQQLAKRYQGDTRVQALNQSMQLPGFWRRKMITLPRLPRITEINDLDPYRFREIAALIGIGDEVILNPGPQARSTYQ